MRRLCVNVSSPIRSPFVREIFLQIERDIEGSRQIVVGWLDGFYTTVLSSRKSLREDRGYKNWLFLEIFFNPPSASIQM